MANIIEAESTLTDRFQTTVPSTVRKALGLGQRDKIHYKVNGDGTASISRASDAHEEDPALLAFLDLIEKDVACHPEHMVLLDDDLFARMDALVGDLDDNVDLTSPLPEDED